MYKHVFAGLAGAVLAVSLSGCSNSSSNSSPSSVTVTAQVGQQDIQDARIWSVAIAESGQPSKDDFDRLVRAEYELDDNGSDASVVVPTEEAQLFLLVPRIADSATGQQATSRTCQWVSGCTMDATTVAFGDRYDQHTGLNWRSVAYDVSKDELIRITPLTHLAAALGYDRQYIESTALWEATGYYTAYSIEQASSQVSRLFGIDHVQSSAPWNLSLINQVSGNQAVAMDRIRYGALLAAWQKLSADYTGDADSMADAVAADLVTNNGQLYQNGGDQTLSLALLYQAARDNLGALTVTNTTIKSYVDAVISNLDTEIAAFTSDSLTSVTPAPLSELFSSSDLADYTLGLQRTKAFVGVLRNYEDTFFEDGYRTELNAYLNRLKAVGDQHEADFNKVITAFVETHELYTECYLNAGCPSDTSKYGDWLSQVDSYVVSTETLTLNNGAIVVDQAVADINPTDGISDPSESQAIDVKVAGTYVSGDLTFKVDHVYKDNDKDNDITSTSGIRVYFTTPVSKLADSASNEIIGYELRWSDFQMYNANDLNTASELEYDGKFRLFYRGVRDPLNAASELRFNIDTVELDSRISDQVSDDNDDDSEASSLDVTATSAFAQDFYPNKRFASFNGFFDANTADGFTKGTVAAGLISYATATETILGETVNYLDVRVPLGDSHRYRLYPSVQREDESDVDGDGDREEQITVYDMETCELSGNNTDGWTVASCLPQQRAVGEADFSDYINALWRAGTLSRIEIPGRGYYFVEWPATAAADSCMALDDLVDGGADLDGTLYLPHVLGLNNLRLTSVIDLSGQPDTLLDARVSRPTTDGYEITAALSHDYSSTSGSTVLVGSGSAVDRIVVNYATDADLVTTGSVAVYKDGVSLQLDDTTTETVDSDLDAYLRQSTNAQPLPYKFVINEDGNYERCVTANVAEWDEDRGTDNAVLFLNFRDVVYGQIKKENGQWIIRYIDGTWETL